MKEIKKIVFTNPTVGDREIDASMIEVYDSEGHYVTYPLYTLPDENNYISYDSIAVDTVREFLDSHHLNFDEALEKGLIYSDREIAGEDLKLFATAWNNTENQKDLDVEEEMAEDMKVTNVVFVEKVMDDGTMSPYVQVTYEDEVSDLIELLDENGKISEKVEDVILQLLEEKNMTIEEAISNDVISGASLDLKRFLEEYTDAFPEAEQDSDRKQIRQIVMYHFDGVEQLEPTENNLDNPDRGMIAQACIFYQDGTFKNIAVSNGTYTYFDALGEAIYDFAGEDMSLLDAINSGVVTSISGEEFEEDFSKYLKGVYHRPANTLIPTSNTSTSIIEEDTEQRKSKGFISKVISKIGQVAGNIKDAVVNKWHELKHRTNREYGFMKKFYQKHPNIAGGLFALTLSLPLAFFKTSDNTRYTCAHASKVGVIKEFTDRNEESIQDILAKLQKKQHDKDKKKEKKNEKKNSKKQKSEQQVAQNNSVYTESFASNNTNDNYNNSYVPENMSSSNIKNDTDKDNEEKQALEDEKKAEAKRKKAEKRAKAKLEKQKRAEEAKRAELLKEVAQSVQDFQENIDNANSGNGPINEDSIGNGTQFTPDNKDQNGNLVDSVEDVTTDGTDSSNGELPDPDALDRDDNYVDQGSYDITESEVEVGDLGETDVVIQPEGGNDADNQTTSENKDVTNSSIVEGEQDIEKLAEAMVDAMENNEQQVDTPMVKTK